MQIPETEPVTEASTPLQMWRWFLVVPGFAAGAVVYDRVIDLNPGIALDLIIYPLAGFVPVFLPGKIAPSRQLLIAVECAVLVLIFTFGVMATIVISWRAGEHSGGGTGFALAFLLIIVVGSISALWMVERKRTGPVDGDLPWAIWTGLLIPLAFVGLVLAKSFLDLY